MRYFFVLFFSLFLGLLTFPLAEEVHAAANSVPSHYQIELTFLPARLKVGKTKTVVLVKDLEGKPASGASVKVRTDMSGMPMGVRPWTLYETAPGKYEGVIEITMAGLWEFKAIVDGKYGAWEKHFQIEVKEEIPFWRGKWFAPILGVISLLGVFIGWRFMGIGVIQPLLIIFVILGGGWLWTTFLPPPPKDSMGMKMDMGAPDMGIPIHLLNAPRPVAVEEIKKETIAREIVYTGTVSPDAEEVVYPRVMGWLVSMPFYPGDKVAKGQEIGTLDTAELSAKTKAALQEIKAQEHDLIVAKEREKEAESMLDKAKAGSSYRERERARADALLAKGAISQEEFDREHSSFLEARAEVKSKEQNLEANTHSLLHHKTMIEKARAEYQEALTVQSYTNLISRLGGVVTERMVNEGVLVSPGMGILKIADLKFVRIQANVSEKDLSQITVGTQVTIKSEKIPGKTISARITSIFNATDPMSRTGRVEARIQNPNSKFFSGDFIEMHIVIGIASSTLTIPSSAIVSHNGKSIVWVVEDGLAKQKPVQTGISNGRRIQVIARLKEGEKVIYAGHQDIQEDDPVKEAAWGSGSFKEILFPLEELEEEE